MKKRSNLKIHVCVLVASLLCVFLSQPAFAAQTSKESGNTDETSAESSVGISAPSELSAAVTESGTISLKWNKSDNAEGYSIYYATKANGEFVHLDDTTETTFSKTFTIGTNYYFKVKAYRNIDNTKTESDFSNTVKIQCGLAQTRLTGISCAGSGKLKVTWDSVSQADGYSFYMATEKDGTYKCLLSTTQTAYTATNLTASQDYYFKVRAYKTVNGSKVFGEFSEIKSETANLKQVKLTNLTSNEDGSMTVAWDKIANAQGYSIYMSTEKDGTYKCIASTSAESYTKKPLDIGTTYYFKVRAYLTYSNAKVFGEFSEIKSKQHSVAIPEFVSALNKDSDKTYLSWNKVTGADGYEVYSLSGEESSDYNLLSTTKETGDTPTRASSENNNYYKIRAFSLKDDNDTKIFSDFSTVLSPDIYVPKDLKASMSESGTITLNWSADSSAEGYSVYYSTKADGDFISLGDTKDNSFSKAFTIGKTYYFKVKSYAAVKNERAEGNFTDTVKIQCGLAKSEITDISCAGSGKLKVTWNSVDKADGYSFYMATEKDGTYKCLLSTTKNTYTATNLTASQDYYFKVRAYKTVSGAKVFGDFSDIKSETANLKKVNITSIESKSNNSLTVSWDKIDNAQGYSIYMATEKDGTYKCIASTSATSYTKTSLAIGNTYYFKIRAYLTYSNAKVFGEFSEIESKEYPIATPEFLSAVNEDSGKTVFNWSKVSGADGYEIYALSNEEDNDFTLLKTAKEETADTPTRANSNEKNYYKVRAFKSKANIDEKSYGDFSAVLSPDIYVPKDLTASISESGTIALNWSADDSAEGYSVYYSTKADSGFVSLGDTKDNSLSRTFEIGKTYYFKVKSYTTVKNERAEGNFTDVVKIQCGLAKSEITDIACAGSGKLKVTWNSVSDADGYSFYMAAEEDGTYKCLLSTTKNTYTVSNLTTGQEYYFKVRAYKTVSGAKVFGDFSDIKRETANLKQVKITDIEAKNDGSLVVTWDKIQNAQGYSIYMSTEKDGTYNCVASTSNTSYTRKSVELNGTYYFKIRAYLTYSGSKVFGEFSDISSKKYTLTPPQITSAENVASRKITLNWDNVYGAEGYSIYWTTGSEENTFTSLTSVTETTFSKAGLTVGENYLFKIRAYYFKPGTTSKIFSEFSPIVKIDNVRGTVTSVNLSNVGNNSLKISWGADSNAVRYNVYLSDSEDGTYEKVGETENAEYIITNLVQKKIYYASVSPVYLFGDKEIEGFKCTPKSAECTISTAENVQAVGSGSGKITLSWDSVEGADGYSAYISDSPNGSYSCFNTVKTTSVTKGSLESGKTYYFKVRPYYVKADGVTTAYAMYTDYVSAVPGLDKVYLRNPVSSGLGKITVEWTAVAYAESYEVAIASEEDGSYETIDSVTEPSFTYENAEQGANCYFRVRAAYTYSDGTVYGKWSDPKSGFSGLNSPANVAAVGNKNGKIDVSWDACDGADGYSVYMSEGDESNYIPMANVNENTFSKASLTIGQTYYFKVRCYYEVEDSKVFSDFSSSVSAKAPVASANITDIAYVNETGIRITWNAVSGATEYRIYKKAANDEEWSKVAVTEDLENLTWIDQDVAANEVYRYAAESCCVNDFGTTLGAIDENGTSCEAKLAEYDIDTTTVPFYTRHINEPTYNEETNSYWTIRSYLDRLDDLGGGTLRIAAGDYYFYGSIYVPSNVTIELADGVTFIKTQSDSLVQFIGQKDRTAGVKYSEHNGVHDSAIICKSGTAVLKQGTAPGTVMVVAHAKNILLDNLTFDGSTGGAHNIELDASQNVEIRNCTFNGSADEADAGVPKEAINLDTPDLKTKGFESSYTTYDQTANDNIYIHNNVFNNHLVAVGTHMYSEEHPHTNVRIIDNEIDRCTYYAIGALYWENPIITGNKFTNIAADYEAAERRYIIKLTGTSHAVIKNNIFDSSMYYLYIGTAFYNEYWSEELQAYQHYGCEMTDEEMTALYDNTFTDVEYPYIYMYSENGKVKTFILGNDAGAEYTVTPTDLPCRKKYTAKNTESYNSKTACYYMLRSYLEEFDAIGGGTLTLKAGTYEVTNILFVPSNTKIVLEEGAVIKKTTDTGTDALTSSSELFYMQHSSESGSIGLKYDYSSSGECVITGSGTIDMNNTSSSAITLSQNSIAEISGITFTGTKGGRYIVVNSSENVEISDCTFTADNDTSSRAVVFSATYNEEPCKNVSVKNSNFTGFGYAISYGRLSEKNYTANVNISNNVFTNCVNGDIMLIGVNGLTLSENVFDTISNDANAAVHFVGVSNLTVTQNEFNNLSFALRLKVDETYTSNDVTTEEVQQIVVNNMFSNIVNTFIPYTLNYGDSQLFCYFVNLDAPVIKTAVSGNLHEAVLEWDSVDNAEKYMVYRSDAEDGDYSIVRNTADTKVTFSDLTNGKTYYFKVRAFYYIENMMVMGEWSDPVSVTIQELTAPEITSVTSEHPTTINLEWTSVPFADGYSIYRSFDPDGEFSYLTSTEDTNYTKDDCYFGKTYYFKVRAYYVENNSKFMSNDYSETVSVTTPSFQKVNLTEVAPNSLDSLLVKWDSVEFAEGYSVYFSNSADGTFTPLVNVTDTSYIKKSCEPDTDYCFKVRAYYFDKTGTKVFGSFSEVLSSKTGLSQVKNVRTAYGSSNKLVVSWDSVTDAAGYSVYYSETPDDGYICLNSVPETSYTTPSLTTGQTYYFKVRAYTEGKKHFSPYSDVVEGTVLTPDKVEPPIVTSGNNREINISWQALDNVDGYEIYACTEEDTAYAYVGETTESEYVMTNLEKTKYTVKVRAYILLDDGKLCGNFSDERSSCPGVYSIENVKVTGGGSNKLVISWDSIDDIEGYSVYMAETPDGEYTCVDSVTENWYTKYNLTAAKTYYFKVRAYVEGKKYFSEYSSVTEGVVTAPDQVEAPTVKSGNGREIKISWNALDYADGYEILSSTEENPTYTCVGETTDCEYILTGLEKIKYNVRVRAYVLVDDIKVYGDLSYVRTGYPGMDKVQNITVKATSATSVKITWDTVDLADIYSIYMATEPDGEYKCIASVSGNSCTRTKMEEGTTYYFKIRTNYSVGDTKTYSGFTDIVEFTL